MIGRRTPHGSWVDSNELELTEKVVDIRRVAKVVKGGRRLSFNAMVVLGDMQGHIGAGMGKATSVPDAIRKGTAVARKNLMVVPLKGTTIPFAIVSSFGGSRVLMKPAPPGAGLIAGGAVRAVMEMAGVKDVTTKSLGSRNPINVVTATIKGLQEIRALNEEETRRTSIKRAKSGEEQAHD